MTAIKVGDTLYRRNESHRVGAERWLPEVICGETPVSWLYAPYGEKQPERGRINKRTMRTKADYRGYRDLYLTRQGTEARDFCDQHARDLGAVVSVCNDPEKLKQIAVIMGRALK